MIPRFTYVRPTTLAEAFEAHDAAGGDAAWYAGGTELLQLMKMGLASFGTLIDLKAIDELRGIEVGEDGTLRIGAGATHREIERDETIARRLPALAALEAHVANIRVRNQGTIGGNLCFAEPHSDPAAFLLACGASVRLASARGGRDVAMEDFIVSPFTTVRELDEIAVAVLVPPATAGEGRAYEKAKFRERPAVSVAVRIRLADGAVTDARVAIGAMTDVPIRVSGAEAALDGVAGTAAGLRDGLAAAAAALAELDAVGDLDGSPDYKRHLAGVLLGRAATTALAEATAGA